MIENFTLLRPLKRGEPGNSLSISWESDGYTYRLNWEAGYYGSGFQHFRRAKIGSHRFRDIDFSGKAYEAMREEVSGRVLESPDCGEIVARVEAKKAEDAAASAEAAEQRRANALATIRRAMSGIGVDHTRLSDDALLSFHNQIAHL